MIAAILSILSVSGLLIISQLSPGPDIFYVVRTTLAQGFRAGWSVALGITLGFTIQALIVCTAGDIILQQSWSQWLLWGAAAWLLYLAYKIFPRHFSPAQDVPQETTAAAEPLLRHIRRGFLCNILNPKCTLFICGLCLPQLKQYAQAFSWYPIALALCLATAGQIGWTLWCGLLQYAPIRRMYSRYSAVIDAIFALLLAFFALGLVYNQLI